MEDLVSKINKNEQHKTLGRSKGNSKWQSQYLEVSSMCTIGRFLVDKKISIPQEPVQNESFPYGGRDVRAHAGL